MNTITKYFKTIKKAEKYQYYLYENFAYVELVRYPIYTEDGLYEWNVSN